LSYLEIFISSIYY